MTNYKSHGQQDMVALINGERESKGLKPVVESKRLNESALAKCNDMIAKNYWDHVSPDGTEPWAFFNKVGYSYHYAGENLVWIYGDTLAMEKLMASPTHAENILKPEYKEVGIGRCGDYIVQHFAER